ncbi:unnamed protein product, partial [Didymodactylos carnosus]
MGKVPDESYEELTTFNSLWQALSWSEIKIRLPVCFSRTIRNWYMLANIVYL